MRQRRLMHLASLRDGVWVACSIDPVFPVELIDPFTVHRDATLAFVDEYRSKARLIGFLAERGGGKCLSVVTST
jgi:hypothetical protein